MWVCRWWGWDMLRCRRIGMDVEVLYIREGVVGIEWCSWTYEGLIFAWNFVLEYTLGTQRNTRSTLGALIMHSLFKLHSRTANDKEFKTQTKKGLTNDQNPLQYRTPMTKPREKLQPSYQYTLPLILPRT